MQLATLPSGKMNVCKLSQFRSKVRRQYRNFVIPLFVGGLLIFTVFSLLTVQDEARCSSGAGVAFTSRHLLQVVANATNTTSNNTIDCSKLNGKCSDECNSAEYPTDLFTCKQKANGAIILHVIGLLYMFVALALVCDEFFVPSLQVIIDKLGISEDVAGATFMAAGGSAPELATSFIGTFIAKSDVGVGTIVGSAVFNILFVISMCAFFSKGVLTLTWWPLFRDICFYSLSLLVLIIAFLDAKIAFYEAMILFFCYIAYVVFMKFNVQAELFVKTRICRQRRKSTAEEEGAEGNDELEPAETDGLRRPSVTIIRSTTGRFRRSTFQLMTNGPETQRARMPKMAAVVTDVMDLVRQNQAAKNGSATADGAGASTAPAAPVEPPAPLTQEEQDARDAAVLAKLSKKPFAFKRPAAQETLLDYEGRAREPSSPETSPLPEVKIEQPMAPTAEEELPELPEENVDEPLDLSWPATTRERITYVLFAPIIWPLWATLSDVRREGKDKYFVVSFLGSIIWIGFYSFLMAWWAKLIGEIIGIPEAIMGLTFLAAGTSIPDLITSVIVAKKGFGDMAVSSSIGSNLFDITVGLPIPWFFWSVTHSVAPVEVVSSGMFCSVLMLFAMLMTVVFSIAAFKWKMSKGLGAAMICLYGVFITFSILMEYGFITCLLN